MNCNFFHLDSALPLTHNVPSLLQASGWLVVESPSSFRRPPGKGIYVFECLLTKIQEEIYAQQSARDDCSDCSLGH
jgi:hypothetical protein